MLETKFGDDLLGDIADQRQQQSKRGIKISQNSQ